jgi:hypothetical protein
MHEFFFSIPLSLGNSNSWCCKVFLAMAGEGKAADAKKKQDDGKKELNKGPVVRKGKVMHEFYVE